MPKAASKSKINVANPKGIMLKVMPRNGQLKDNILEIGYSVCLIPFLDDLTPEIEVLDSVFETISTLGNAGLRIQGIVAHPESAPMDLLGSLTRPSGRSEDEFAKMAKIRQSLSEDEVGNSPDD